MQNNVDIRIYDATETMPPCSPNLDLEPQQNP